MQCAQVLVLGFKSLMPFSPIIYMPRFYQKYLSLLSGNWAKSGTKWPKNYSSHALSIRLQGAVPSMP